MNHPILRINEHTVSVGKSKRSIAKIVFKKILDRAYKQSLSWLDQIFRFVVCIMCILVGEGGVERARVHGGGYFTGAHVGPCAEYCRGIEPFGSCSTILRGLNPWPRFISAPAWTMMRSLTPALHPQIF